MPSKSDKASSVAGEEGASQSLRSRHSRSMGLSSGAYGGKNSTPTLGGRRNAWALWNAPLSSRSRWNSVGWAVANWSRKS